MEEKTYLNYLPLSVSNAPNILILSGDVSKNETHFFSANITVMFCHLKYITVSGVKKRFRLSVDVRII